MEIMFLQNVVYTLLTFEQMLKIWTKELKVLFQVLKKAKNLEFPFYLNIVEYPIMKIIIQFLATKYLRYV